MSSAHNWRSPGESIILCSQDKGKDGLRGKSAIRQIQNALVKKKEEDI